MGSQECDIPPAFQVKQSAKVMVWQGIQTVAVAYMKCPWFKAKRTMRTFRTKKLSIYKQ